MGLYMKDPAAAATTGGNDTSPVAPVLPPVSPVHSVGITGFLASLFGGRAGTPGCQTSCMDHPGCHQY
jgi:hypothetical protein